MQEIVESLNILSRDLEMGADSKNDNKEGSGGRPGSISLDEYSLWQDFKNGDIGAYAVIYRKYFFALFNYGKKISDDHELIKDCIQELFIKIWNNRENLAETTSIKHYLFTSLKNKILDALRKKNIIFIHARNTVKAEGIDILEIPDHIEEPSGNIQRDKVSKALNILSQHQQKILDLKFNQDLSNKEIADEMGITIQSVYNAVFKALRSIRKQISQLVILMLVCPHCSLPFILLAGV